MLKKYIKSIMLSTVLVGSILSPLASAEVVKIGLLNGISGPISSMAPGFIAAARMAIKQVNEQGGLFDTGSPLVAVFGDSGCNPQNAIDGATKLVNLKNISAMVGPNCSGATIAAAKSVTIPAGLLMVSPTATAPTVSTLNDNDLVFRTVPSDAYQGQALARTLIKRGLDNVAVAYINNDYGKGLAEAFRAEFEKNGGKINGYEGHEGAKASYRSALAKLAQGGAPTLIVFDYASDSGLTILRQSLENGFFTNFVGGDGMKSDALISQLGEDNLENFFTSSPVGEKNNALSRFNQAFSAYGGDPNAIFATTSYDAAFLVALAVEKAKSGNRRAIAQSLRSVATAPGISILPGEWAKAKKAIAEGKEINYQGASGSQDFDTNGDVPGTFALFKVGGGTWITDEEMK